MEQVAQFLKHLGEWVERDWSRSAFDLAAFPETAVRALRTCRPIEHLSAMDVVEWVHGTDALPAQMDIAARFGNPPVTVFRGQGFHIDVYYWLEGDTDIHQHAFCGAFTVLQGTSLQGVYAFEKGRVLHPRLIQGQLALESLRLLTPGDIQPLAAGADFLHSVLHLDYPTVTLLIRADVPASGPQHSYAMPGLSYLHLGFCEQPLRRRVQLLRMMDRVDPPRMRAQLRAGLRTADPLTFAHLVFESRPLFQNDWQGFADLLNDVYPEQEEVLDALLPVLRDVKRINRINGLKNAIAREPDLRYLTALLFFCTHRSRFIEALRSRFPEAEPLEKACALLSRLSAVAGPELGFDMTPAATTALRALLLGQSEGALLATARPEASPADLAKAYHTLRGSDLLSTLLSTNQV